MKTKLFLCAGILLIIGLAPSAVFGQSSQTTLRDLGEALSGGTVSLTANGNGGSSGASIDGRLKNNTSGEVFINIIVKNGLFLRNSGAGQNMVASQILFSDGSYMSGNIGSFIRLAPNASVPVLIVAFCADFERDNPNSSETFTSAAMPQDIRSIAAKISRFMADNFNDDDLTIPAQLALWRVRGQTRSAIAEKFDFDDSDWKLADAIINY